MSHFLVLKEQKRLQRQEEEGASQIKTMRSVLKIMRKADVEVEREEIREVTPIVEILRLLLTRFLSRETRTGGGRGGDKGRDGIFFVCAVFRFTRELQRVNNSPDV